MMNALKMFKYLSRIHMLSLLSMGTIRVGTLHDFRRLEHQRGIADPQEGKKVVLHPIDHLYIEDSKSQNIKNDIDFRAIKEFGAISIGNVKDITINNLNFSKSLNVRDCFILCTSKICSKETMLQFGGVDSCVEIVEIDSFHKLLTETLNSITPVFFVGIYEIIYQDREEKWNGRDWGRHPALIKETKFVKEGEIRALWQPRSNKPISPINLGNYRLTAFCREVTI